MSETPDETQHEPETQEQDGTEPEAPAPTEDEEEEAAELEETEGQQGEPEPEPEASGAAGAVGEKELERMFKKVDAANARYLKSLEGIMGNELGVLETCPVCSDPFLGLIFPPLMRPIDPSKKPAILAVIGEQVSDVTEHDPYARQCDACKGMGRVLSGSRLNSERTLVCIGCKGRGWIPVGDERRVAQNNVAAPVPTNGAEVVAEQPPDTDPWGRGPTDPDYGKLPQFVGR